METGNWGKGKKGDSRPEKGALRQAQGPDRKEDRTAWKILNSSRLRSPVSILLFLTVFVVPIFAVDINKPAVGLASGITVDIAPFGIEQLYFTAQGSYTLPGAIALSLKPAISINDSSRMIRVPLVINLSMYVDKKDFFLLSGYFGGGLEVYRSAAHNTGSPLLTGGITLAAGSFYIDIPVTRAYRSLNTDSDISLTAGFYFQR